MKFKKIVSGIMSAAMALTAFGGMNLRSPEKALVAEAAAANWKFDLGGKGAASGYTGVSATDGYSASKGYGFAQTGNVSNVSASGSGALSDAVQFNKTNGENTFNVDLPKGLYEITVTTGNTSRTSIKAEGMLQLINLTGNNAVEKFQIPVTDGQLNIQAVEGKSGTAFSISAIDIKQLNTTGATNPTIWICGDSTVCNYYNSSASSQHGWGQFFGSHVSSKGYVVRNMAASGQYAKGFVSAGQFKPIETYGKKGDVYIISIGINDTNYSNATEYYNTVTDMVKKSKAKGMDVILVKQQGRRSDLNKKPLLDGRWFGGQLDTIGKEQSVQVVDLFKAWQNFGVSQGYNAMASYYATKNDGSADDLHQSTKGAQKLAELMAGLVSLDAGSDAPPPETPDDPPATREPSEMDTTKAYMLKNVNSGLYLEVAEQKAEAGANVQQWGASGAAVHNTWHFKHKGYNYYEVWSYLGDGGTYLLDIVNGSADNGANVTINTNTNTGAQWFRFFDNGDGSYTMVSRCSGDAGAVEVNAKSTEPGANIQQWAENGGNNQKWVLEEVTAPGVQQPEVTTTPTPTSRPTTTTTTTVANGNVKKYPGDANSDNKLTLSDAVLIMQYIGNPDLYGVNGSESMRMTAQGLINADVTGGGDGVTNLDALFIQRVLLKLETMPEIEYDPPQQDNPPQQEENPSVYYALDQTWQLGTDETTNEGYTKDGYVNLDNVVDSNITWTVNVAQDGNYYAAFRVANGTDADRKMKVYVNGNTSSYWVQPFTGTGSWTTWEERGIVLPLKSGTNTIKMVSATEGGSPNFDTLTLQLTDEPIAEIYDPSSEQQNKPVVSEKPVIYIAGDSTVQSYKASYAPQQGWGYYLQNYFNSNVSVSNQALAGRSSKSFYDQGRFKTITDSLKKGDFVLIQFAINDAGSNKAERYAPVGGNVDNPKEGTYEWYMTQFIKDTLAKGATPVLVTTVIGMKAYSGGKFVNSYNNYCDACKKLAAKYKIPCIDLNSLMVSHYNKVGYDTAKSYHLMGAVSGSTDGTHFCEKGANIVAGIVADAIKNQKITGLAEYAK